MEIRMNEKIIPTVPIRVFYHVTCVNHYLEITKYIFDRIISSGLYEHIDGIYIGALGDGDAILELQKLIGDYPKAKISAHSIRKADYEFHTLRLLKYDADTLPKFYSVYLHSKSISYPKEGNDQGKTPNDHLWDMFWMKFMCHYVVTEWERWYKALSLKGWGYDIAGCRVVPARLSASSRTHASGNFWAANSEYIKTLSDEMIEWAEWKDIFNGEMWAFSGNPIVYILSNMFSDAFPFDQDFDTYMANFEHFDEYQI